jgi:hypothetical protein
MTEFNNLTGLRHSEQLVAAHNDTAAVDGSGTVPRRLPYAIWCLRS